MGSFEPPGVFPESATTSRVFNDDYDSASTTTFDTESSMSDSDTGFADSIIIEDDLSTPRPSTPLESPVTRSPILERIEGLYPIFDLISEQSAGGLVDKVIIDQDNLRSLINAICPGAYKSITRVDFKALDGIVSQMVGIYGDRTVIVDFMKALGAFETEETAEILKQSSGSLTSYTGLRSGLYIFRPSMLQKSTDHSRLFVIYWPEDTTWSEAPSAAVQRNRVTFLRYLSQACHQVVCMPTSQQVQNIDWTEKTEDPIDEDETDRVFTFEVSKVKDEAEGVSARPGFNVALDAGIFGGLPEPPMMLAGETTQAFMTTRHVQSSDREDDLAVKPLNGATLKSHLLNSTLILDEEADDNTIDNLTSCGLKEMRPHAVEAWMSRRAQIRDKYRAIIDDECRKVDISSRQRADAHKLENEEAIHCALVQRVLVAYSGVLQAEVFPFVGPDRAVPFHDRIARYASLHQHQRFQEAIKPYTAGHVIESIPSREFQTLKEKVLAIQYLLLPTTTCDNCDALIHNDLLSWNLIRQTIAGKESMWNRLFSSQTEKLRQLKNDIDNLKRMNDVSFLTSLPALQTKRPDLEKIVLEVISAAHRHFEEQFDKARGVILRQMPAIQDAIMKQDIRARSLLEMGGELAASRAQFADELNMRGHARILRISKVEKVRQDLYRVHGGIKVSVPPCVQYSIRCAQLSREDEQDIRLDVKNIPSPQVETRPCTGFSLPENDHVLFISGLSNEKFLVVVRHSNDAIDIYLDDGWRLSNAIKNHSPLRSLRVDKIGGNIRICFDERHRLLALCLPTQLSLLLFKFNESFKSLASFPAPFDLKPWYMYGNVDLEICSATFVQGREEILLVDSTQQGRIFSLVTNAFRPATLLFGKQPSYILSAPDSSAFIAITDSEDDGSRAFTVYHWDSFGSTTGIPLILPCQTEVHSTFGITSFVSRSCTHLVVFDSEHNRFHSVALSITKKETELQFTARSGDQRSQRSNNAANSFLDCHADVWTRFPVVPAIERHDSVIAPYHARDSLTFVTLTSKNKFQRYFLRMIQTFDIQTQKPGADSLREINVNTMAFNKLISHIQAVTLQASLYSFGRWVMNLLCLIPIQIAIPKGNTLVPLRDGILSAEMELSLTGATVSQVIDSISFGWYESIFRSYLAQKPVKVVSSMGEQSVGKSYMLNHFVGASFAGSAMRTTEGVWMSVTNTEDTLIVALDYEGVHSIERSTQEDAFLVLLNAAMSNLVLFRNNFSVSRDIKEFFKSFQSSSLILDPQRNPELFSSTLAIIIKDVIESDKKDIVREFSLRFQGIVKEEQQRNFISQLHGGEVHIIPWPIMQSREFYKPFGQLKRRLQKQPVTHRSAGEFIFSLKTFIAKIKATDWHSMSQTLISHRTRKLQEFLPNALTWGCIETEPNYEPLKNFDSDISLPSEDSAVKLFLSGQVSSPQIRDRVLLFACSGWSGFKQRDTKTDNEWLGELSAHLAGLVERRTAHVQGWIHSNVSRFQGEHADIQALSRHVDVLVQDLKANAELCRMPCNNSGCQLGCLKSRRHDPDEGHTCYTDHSCGKACCYIQEHSESLPKCGFPAGHNGDHICAVNAHLCGAPCRLNDKKGCMRDCTNQVGHDGDHLCSAPMHSCGQPCALRDAPAPNRRFTCTGTCSTPRS